MRWELYYGLPRFGDGWNFDLRKMGVPTGQCELMNMGFLKHVINSKLSKIVMTFSKFHQRKSLEKSKFITEEASNFLRPLSKVLNILNLFWYYNTKKVYNALSKELKWKWQAVNTHSKSIRLSVLLDAQISSKWQYQRPKMKRYQIPFKFPMLNISPPGHY